MFFHAFFCNDFFIVYLFILICRNFFYLLIKSKPFSKSSAKVIENIKNYPPPFVKIA